MKTTPLPASLSGGFPSNFAASERAADALRRTQQGAIHGPLLLGANAGGHPWPPSFATSPEGVRRPQHRTVTSPPSYVGREAECGFAAERYKSLSLSRKMHGGPMAPQPAPPPSHSPRGVHATGWRHPCRLSGPGGSVLQACRLVPRTARDVRLCLPRPLALPHCPPRTSQGGE